MSDSESAWHLYAPETSYHYHALGVLSAAFNKLEFRLLGLHLLYMGFNDPAMFVFHKMRDNSFRIDLLRRMVEFKGETPEIKEGVVHFCAGFDRCAQNRNILMHSSPNTVSEDGKAVQIAFTKATKNPSFEWNQFFLDLKGLRRVAEETITFSLYGKGIFEHIISEHRGEDLQEPHLIKSGLPLPGKPPLPTLLTPQPLPTPINA